jgi:hypothetical protein
MTYSCLGYGSVSKSYHEASQAVADGNLLMRSKRVTLRKKISRPCNSLSQKKFKKPAQQEEKCVSYGSRIKQRLFTYTELIRWAL